MTTESEFVTMIKKHETLIYKVCYLYARGDRETVRDLYQDVVCALWKSRWRYGHRSSEQTWIYRVALNTVVSRHRGRRRMDFMGPMPDDVADSLPFVDDGELVERLYDLISRLPVAEQKLVYLYLDGLRINEMAQVLGLSYSSVGVGLHRIKEKLRTMNQNIK